MALRAEDLTEADRTRFYLVEAAVIEAEIAAKAIRRDNNPQKGIGFAGLTSYGSVRLEFDGLNLVASPDLLRIVLARRYGPEAEALVDNPAPAVVRFVDSWRWSLDLERRPREISGDSLNPITMGDVFIIGFRKNSFEDTGVAVTESALRRGSEFFQSINAWMGNLIRKRING